MTPKKVAVAMSGGVDSSTTAALLKENGFQVFGITLQIWSPEMFPEKRSGFRNCCSIKAIEDAKAVCANLGISHYVLNFREIFEKEVISNFIQEYLQGRTPNPCIVCNQIIKFAYLLDRIKIYQADYLATGHYARIVYNEDIGEFHLKKGIDRDKDQSYFLYNLNQAQLASILMPLGEFTKDETRVLAKKYELLVAEKEESQEVCFVPDNDYRKFLKTKNPKAFSSGNIVDSEGKVIGKHDGIANFTVGQRRGISIAAENPLYVLEIRADSNEIVVGFQNELERNIFEVENLSFIQNKPPSKSFKVTVKVRYRSKEVPAKVNIFKAKRARINLDENQTGIAPGQAAVFYDGDIVIGGGVIC